MSVLGIRECACADFAGHPMPEPGAPPVFFRGRAGIRQALELLRECRQRERTDHRYHGGVHVDGVHVLAILGGDGAPLYEGGLRTETRVHGRVLTPEERQAISCAYISG